MRQIFGGLLAMTLATALMAAPGSADASAQTSTARNHKSVKKMTKHHSKGRHKKVTTSFTK